MNIKELSKQGEMELAEVPPSGKDSGIEFTYDKIDKGFKDFYIRNPFISLVGSNAVHGYSKNDIDLVVEGEDLPQDIREAIDFRLYRQVSKEFDIPYNDTGDKLQIFYKRGKPYTSYVPLYALKLERIREPNKIQMSNDVIPMNLLGSFDIISKAGDKRRIIAGYASVVEIDKENHIIPKEALENGIETLLKNSDYANLMLVHQNIQIGKIIPEYENLKTHVDDVGLFIVCELRTDLDTSNKLWKAIMEGKYNGFSIAAEVIHAYDDCDDTKCVKVIDKLNIFEVSVCELPTNAKSGFIVVSKGEYESLDDVSEDVNNKITNDMKKKISKSTEVKDEECPECTDKSEDTVTKDDEEVIEEEPETEAKEGEEETPEPAEEISLEEKLEEQTRQITALTGIVEELRSQIQSLAKPAEEEEEMPEEEEEEEEMAEPEPVPEKAKPKKEDEEMPEEEEPSKYPYPEKKDFDELKNEFTELKKSINSLVKGLKDTTELDNMDKLLKSKDDEISNLTQQVEKLEKAEIKPKTSTKVTDKTKNTKEYSPKLVTDPVSPGIIYKDPDY